MPRFCTRCGKPLEEGEICSCQQPVAAGHFEDMPQTAAEAAAPEPPAPENPSQTGAYDAPAKPPYQEQYGMPGQAPSYGGPEMPPHPAAPPPYAGQGLPPQGAPTPPYGAAQPQPGAPAYPGQMPPAQAPRPTRSAGVFFHNIGNLIAGFFKKPVDMIRAATEHQDMGIGFFFAGVNALFVALFMGVFISRLGAILSGLVGGMSSYWGYGMSMSLPFLPFFFSGLVMAVLGYFLLSLLTFLVGKIGKGSVSLKGTFAALGVSTFPSTLCMALAIVLALLIPDWSLYVAVFALLLWVMYSYQASSVCTKIGENKNYFLYPLAFLVMFLFTAFVTFKILGWAMMQIQISGSGLW